MDGEISPRFKATIEAVSRRKKRKLDKFKSRIIDRVEQRCESLSGAPAKIKKYVPRISGWAPSPSWKTHKLQKDALDELERRDNIFLASYERFLLGVEGQRRFISSSPEEFFFYYFQLPPDQRTHYEVIPEGRLCKLYFDLEFGLSGNEWRDADGMTHTLISLVNAALEEMGHSASPLDDILILDSSNEAKFSRHLIFTRTVFKDNSHAGAFVNQVLDRLKGISETCLKDTSPEKDGETSKTQCHIDNCSHADTSLFGHTFTSCQLWMMMFRSGCDDFSTFVDSAVYSKNRNFRLLKSTKLRKNRFLERSPLCRYSPKVSAIDASFRDQFLTITINIDHIDPSFYRTFLDSLITNIDWPNYHPIRILPSPSSGRLPTIPEDEPARKRLFQPDRHNSHDYPEIENFIVKHYEKWPPHSNQHKVQLRNCVKFDNSNVLCYEVGHTYRYCQRIGRFHKSNKIKVCVDLGRRVFYQKCFDPDCRDFKGNEIPLPASLFPWHGLEQDLGDDWGYE